MTVHVKNKKNLYRFPAKRAIRNMIGFISIISFDDELMRSADQDKYVHFFNTLCTFRFS